MNIKGHVVTDFQRMSFVMDSDGQTASCPASEAIACVRPSKLSID